jgi:hypothetical protein
MELHVSTILPLNVTHLKQTTAMIGKMVDLKMVTTIVTSTTYTQITGHVRPLS